MAPTRTCASFSRCASTGIARRTTVTAVANTPSTRPIDEALKPRWWPSTGTRKECTSQLEEMSQLTNSSRPEARQREQIPRGLAPPGARRDHRLGRNPTRPRQRRERQDREHGEGETEPAGVDERAREHRADDVGQRRREAEPREHLLQLGRIARHAAGCALDRDQAEIGAGPGEQAGGAQGRDLPARQRRPEHGAQAAGDRQQHRDLDRQVVAVTIGEAPGRQREDDGRDGEAAEDDAERPRPRGLRRGTASGAAMRMPAMHECSATWPPMSAEQRAAPVAASASPQPSAGSSKSISIVDGNSAAVRSAGSASTSFSARPMARVRVSALPM